VLAATALCDCPPYTSQRQAKHQLVGAIRGVAERLGNTPAVCRKAYVHPMVFEMYMRDSNGLRVRRKLTPVRGLSAAECRVLALLRAHARAAERASA
jgi:DNA topoisomerase-1